jgi:hypothetical protein
VLQQAQRRKARIGVSAWGRGGLPCPALKRVR